MSPLNTEIVDILKFNITNGYSEHNLKAATRSMLNAARYHHKMDKSEFDKFVDRHINAAHRQLELTKPN